MTRSVFVHLHPIGLNACDMEGAAYEIAKRTWLCAGCGAPKPSAGIVDVHIENERPVGTPITFVSATSIIIAHQDFIEKLGADRVRNDLLLGTVRNGSGLTLSDWMTVRGRHRVIVRGSKNVYYRRCDLCGRHIYFAMGRRYLFPAPSADAVIQETDLGGLIVPSELFESLSIKRTATMGIEKLKVLSEPLDSLGDLI